MAPNNDGRNNRHISTSEIRPDTDSSFETTSNPPGSHESFSIFGDSACGEPLQPQQLTLDFTPMEDVDNDFVQRKCCAFWDFLNSRTDLHYLMVMPEKNIYKRGHSEPSTRQDRIISTTEEESQLIKEKTAVSMLEFVEEKVCKWIEDCKSCRSHPPLSTIPESSSDVKVMCTKMREWDNKHPKSMEPPGHPPALIHSLMQRKVIT